MLDICKALAFWGKEGRTGCSGRDGGGVHRRSPRQAGEAGPCFCEDGRAVSALLGSRVQIPSRIAVAGFRTARLGEGLALAANSSLVGGVSGSRGREGLGSIPKGAGAPLKAGTGSWDGKPGKGLTFRRAFVRLDAAAGPSGRIPVRLISGQGSREVRQPHRLAARRGDKNLATPSRSRTRPLSTAASAVSRRTESRPVGVWIVTVNVLIEPRTQKGCRDGINGGSSVRPARPEGGVRRPG